MATVPTRSDLAYVRPVGPIVWPSYWHVRYEVLYRARSGRLRRIDMHVYDNGPLRITQAAMFEALHKARNYLRGKKIGLWRLVAWGEQ